MIYWYKADLRSFLASVLNDPGLLARYDWQTSYKRSIVSELIDFMSTRETTYQDELIHLIEEVCGVTDFAHLRWLEDGAAKETAASTAVQSLRRKAEGHLQLVEDARKRGQQRDRRKHAPRVGKLWPTNSTRSATTTLIWRLPTT